MSTSIRTGEEPAVTDGPVEPSLYLEQVRAFQAHAAMFAIGMVIIFTVNLATNALAGVAGEFSAWWSLWALVGWGAGISVHGLVVLLARPDHQR